MKLNVGAARIAVIAFVAAEVAIEAAALCFEIVVAAAVAVAVVVGFVIIQTRVVEVPVMHHCPAVMIQTRAVEYLELCHYLVAVVKWMHVFEFPI